MSDSLHGNIPRTNAAATACAHPVADAALRVDRSPASPGGGSPAGRRGRPLPGTAIPPPRHLPTRRPPWKPPPSRTGRPRVRHSPATTAARPETPARPVRSDALLAAARALLPVLETGRPLDATTLRSALTESFGASDAAGAWAWKDAYEAAEAAVVMFVQRFGRAMRRSAGPGPDGPCRMLAMLEAVAALEPSHTRRSEDQVRLQQFSTPLPLAYAALQAAAVRPGDTVLEPSAGTGMLAVMAECALGDGAGARLRLNEIAQARTGLLAGLFPGTTVTSVDAEAVADRLPRVVPTVVMMNPPFSATPGVDRIRTRRRPPPCPLGLLDCCRRAGVWSRSPRRAASPATPPGPAPSTVSTLPPLRLHNSDRRARLRAAGHGIRHAPDRA